MREADHVGVDVGNDGLVSHRVRWMDVELRDREKEDGEYC